jgi:hypothetical protein
MVTHDWLMAPLGTSDGLASFAYGSLGLADTRIYQ